MKTKRTSRGSGRNCRSGVAVTELALCLPLLVLLLLGSIESCNMIFIRHSLSVAGYEGVRTAIRKNSTAQDAINAAEAMLEDREIVGAHVTVYPPDLSDVQPGQIVRIQITAQGDDNRVVAPWFFWGRQIEANATMAKE